MSHISKVTDVITFPARTAVGAASLGLRTTVRVLGWVAEQALEHTPGRSTPTVTVPAPRPAEADVDPMAPTRTPPPEAVEPTSATKAPAKKVPASQVPLKSAPTPSLPAALETFDDDVDEMPAPAPVTRTAAKKAPAKKTAATKSAAKKTSPQKSSRPTKKAPSKQAAVLAPALGLSEDEVVEVIGGPDGDNG